MERTAEKKFDGKTFNEARDGERLGEQLAVVKKTMLDGQWHTLQELCEITYASAASVSARVRDLRKAKFGGYDVERLYVRKGLWMYRLVTASTAQAA